MTGEPGRNEPCPCGSSLKYKRCCLPRVKGIAVPAIPPDDPRNVHFEMDANGQWVEKPGSIWCQMHMEEANPPDAGIRNAFAPYRVAVQHHPVLVDRVRDCVHKCRASDFHRRTIRAEIERIVEDYAPGHKGQPGAAFVWRNEVLLYETEAFLFQTKSAVDALVRLLAPVVPALEPFDMFRGKGTVAGGAVLDVLEKREPELHALFEAARTQWIQQLKEFRDTVTHVSELEGLTSFVESQYHGGPHTTIEFPKMPTGQRLDVYCGDIVDALMDLTMHTLDEALSRIGVPLPDEAGV